MDVLQGDKLYQAFLQAGGNPKKAKGLQKKVTEYSKWIEGSALKLFKELKKQKHSQDSAFFTLVKLLEIYYYSVGMPNPQVSLPRPVSTMQKGVENERNG
jgi:hypothetical protein